MSSNGYAVYLFDDTLNCRARVFENCKELSIKASTFQACKSMHAMSKLCDLLRNNQSIINLTVESLEISESNVAELKSALAFNTTLKCLDLSECSMDAAAVAACVEAFYEYRKDALDELRLPDTPYQNTEYHKARERIEKMRQEIFWFHAIKKLVFMKKEVQFYND